MVGSGSNTRVDEVAADDLRSSLFSMAPVLASRPGQIDCVNSFSTPHVMCMCPNYGANHVQECWVTRDTLGGQANP